MYRNVGLLAIAAVLLLASCSKKDINDPTTSNEENTLESCSFGITQFNLSKRETVVEALGRKPLNISFTGANTNATSSNVIYLDFDGQNVTGTNWNVAGAINCTPANLSSADIDLVFQRVAADFAPFNITVTTNEAVYNSANTKKRMRVVVTETWQPFGQAGGVSYIGSFTWGNNTPCFVFSSLLGYNTKKIAEACSHEAGHTLGLRHQSSYNENGIKISEYNWGQGSGEIGWAPIMGGSYNQNLSLWHYGPSNISATTMQDDIARIANVVGFIPDEYSNTITGAAALSTTRAGIINNKTDIDFFSVNLASSKTVSLVPANVGPGNNGGNLDLVLNIYNSQGSLISTINDPVILNAGITLSPGSYNLSASTTDNQFTTKYGMLSKYNISLN